MRVGGERERGRDRKVKFKPLVVLQARVCVSVECHRTGRMMTCQIARSKKLGKYLRPEKQTQKNPVRFYFGKFCLFSCNRDHCV